MHHNPQNATKVRNNADNLNFRGVLRFEVHEKAYLVADRIDGGKTNHHRHKESAYPHANRRNN